MGAAESTASNQGDANFADGSHRRDDDGDRRGEGPGFLTRVVRVFLGLFSAHAEIARREAERDRDRLLGGAVLIGVGAVLFAIVIVLAHVAAIVALHDRSMRWLHAIGITTVVDLLVGLLLVRAGAARLRGPVMTETRTLLRRTVTAMTSQ